MSSPAHPAQRTLGRSIGAARQFAARAPDGAVSLGVGQPTWNLPEPARAVLAAWSGPCSYAPVGGLPALKKAIAGYHSCDPNDILVTAGAAGALFSLIQAWVDPGDRVLVPDPGYPLYTDHVELAGGQVVYYTHPLDDHGSDAQAIIKELREARPRVVIINSPNNPAGDMIERAGLEKLSTECERQNTLLVSDEVYRDLYFERRPPSLREVTSYGVVVSSVSKGWAAPGLRVGWVIGDRRWLDAAEVVHSYSVTSAALPSQLAARALLEHSDSILPESRKQLAVRWTAFRSALRDHLGIDPEAPNGSFYYWMQLPEAEENPIAFCQRLRDEARVTILPGIFFGPSGYDFARISFGARLDDIAEGVKRLATLWH